MIYLIDDKEIRQKEFRWSSEVLKKYKDVLSLIYTNEEFQNLKGQIIAENNVILFHESFFDTPGNYKKNNSSEIRQNILDNAKKNNQLVVFFSGSIGSRSVDSNVAYIPVEILYGNLAVFCESYRAESAYDINKIVYGSMYQKEQILITKSKIWESLFEIRDDENVKLSPSLLDNLEKLEKLAGKKITQEGITNGYLKFQIQNI